MSIYYLVGAVCAPISGWLGDRFGAQKMMALGGVLYLVSMVLLGSVTELWQFFIVFGVLLASTQSISMVPLMRLSADGFGGGWAWALESFGLPEE